MEKSRVAQLTKKLIAIMVFVILLSSLLFLGQQESAYAQETASNNLEPGVFREFHVLPESNMIEGNGWRLGDIVTVQVKTRGGEVIFDEQATVEVAPWGVNKTWVHVEYPEGLMRNGYVVTMTDIPDNVTRKIIYKPLYLCSVDYEINKFEKSSKFLSPPQADGVLRNFAPTGTDFS